MIMMMQTPKNVAAMVLIPPTPATVFVPMQTTPTPLNNTNARLVPEKPESINFTIPYLNQLHKTHKRILGAAVNTLDLLDLSRSTLKQSEISSSSASLTLDEVVSNIEAMKWQESTEQLWITWAKILQYWLWISIPESILIQYASGIQCWKFDRITSEPNQFNSK
ncbi:hypothetical protein AALP_AAs67976U000100 [Arabis alpina]|uniref:Uncharacterized protein n=1 Tax=Arabis alpina TaxID=50452 RepID=A0A087G1Z8_ARAAL|nr:hypothetical protein AALP_AAs67976U000100 [Arabis alpina]